MSSCGSYWLQNSQHTWNIFQKISFCNEFGMRFQQSHQDTVMILVDWNQMCCHWDVLLSFLQNTFLKTQLWVEYRITYPPLWGSSLSILQDLCCVIMFHWLNYGASQKATIMSWKQISLLEAVTSLERCIMVAGRMCLIHGRWGADKPHWQLW